MNTPKNLLDFIEVEEYALEEELELSVENNIKAIIDRQITLSGHQYTLPIQEHQDIEYLENEQELPF